MPVACHFHHLQTFCQLFKAILAETIILTSASAFPDINKHPHRHAKSSPPFFLNRPVIFTVAYKSLLSLGWRSSIQSSERSCCDIHYWLAFDLMVRSTQLSGAPAEFLWLASNHQRDRWENDFSSHARDEISDKITDTNKKALMEISQNKSFKRSLKTFSFFSDRFCS